MKHYWYFILIFFLSLSCGDYSYDDGSTAAFTFIPSKYSGITFQNKLIETAEFNFLNYSYIYNGGGVAVGDINNDGLEDIYFTSNQGSNKLYLNKGNFKFKDITDKAGVRDDQGWSTGVSMVDINNDGWLDIYVCKSASVKNRKARQNQLFINQKDNTFKEEALKYGLKEYSFSTQAYFLDYDKDGDLDLYLVNHSIEPNQSLYLEPQNLPSITKDDIDKLFRNDNGKYVDISKSAGISSLRAWGLSASIGDFNNDSWPDIFVANDFSEPDFLYINNHDGTFTNKALESFRHISNNSMGSDFADINNDMMPDLVVLDMLSADRKRGKENMASMDIAKFNQMVNLGYHHQYMSNMLQLNNGNGSFSEIGQLAKISKTDWSWAPLIADFNNDGLNDIFITNGIEKDIANQDFRTKMFKKDIVNDRQKSFEEAKKLIPSTKLANYMFINKGDYTFKDSSSTMGFSHKLNSNGVAFADLDNDGDLDLILNNQLEQASIYRNNSSSNYIKFKINGPIKNSSGIGGKIEIYYGDQNQYKDLYFNRGYQSSMGRTLHFGLDKTENIDSVKVIWNDGKSQKLTNLNANQTVEVNYNPTELYQLNNKIISEHYKEIKAEDLGIDYVHKSVNFDDYSLQILLPQKQSTIDQPLEVADVNGDGLEDIFIGNTSGYPAELFFQLPNGMFKKSEQDIFIRDKGYNDNKVHFFDVDNDGDLDLYITTGNYGMSSNSRLLQDRLYINNGQGLFSNGQLPQMLTVTKAITSGDFDNDGDLDLFVGGRVIPGQYPKPPKSYILENRSGRLVDVSTKILSDTQSIGLVNDAVFSDYDVDGDLDLVIVGEWMPVSFLKNEENGFKTDSSLTKDNSSGWFQSILATDFDLDGNDEYFVGNLGLNNKFQPNDREPLHIYGSYFDDNETYDIAISKESNGDIFPVRGKECSSQQTPFLIEKIESYSEFANSDIFQIYGQQNINNALHLEASTFSSVYIDTNNDDLSFTDLPVEAQFGPILDFELFNKHSDTATSEILGFGTIYDAEVETIRYDASDGFTLSSQDNNFKVLNRFNKLINEEVKAIKIIQIKNHSYLIVLVANKGLKLFKLN